MRQETRVSLLVGLAIIIFFGIIIGERSLNPPKSSDSSQDRLHKRSSPLVKVRARPSHELYTATISSKSHDDRPVLAPKVVPVPNGRDKTATPAKVGSTASSAINNKKGEFLQTAATKQPPKARVNLTAPNNIQKDSKSSPSTSPLPETIRIYRVKPGDTLIGIAKKVYGRGGKKEYLRIFQANRDRLSDPSMLPVGITLIIPPLEQSKQPTAHRDVAHKHYTEMTLDQLQRHFRAERTYIVRAGDNLTSIARRTMGDGSRSAVKKLLEVNRDCIKDPDRITVGMKLVIPQ